MDSLIVRFGKGVALRRLQTPMARRTPRDGNPLSHRRPPRSREETVRITLSLGQRSHQYREAYLLGAGGVKGSPHTQTQSA